MTLLNSNYEELRKANPTASSDDFKFSCKKLNPAGALFDYAKLCDVSKNEIARLDAPRSMTLRWNMRRNSTRTLPRRSKATRSMPAASSPSAAAARSRART